MVFCPRQPCQPSHVLLRGEGKLESVGAVKSFDCARCGRKGANHARMGDGGLPRGWGEDIKSPEDHVPTDRLPTIAILRCFWGAMVGLGGMKSSLLFAPPRRITRGSFVAAAAAADRRAALFGGRPGFAFERALLPRLPGLFVPFQESWTLLTS